MLTARRVFDRLIHDAEDPLRRLYAMFLPKADEQIEPAVVGSEYREADVHAFTYSD